MKISKQNSVYQNQEQTQEQKDYFEDTQRASYGLPPKQKLIKSRPQRFGKSALVTNGFLASLKAGENPTYQHPDYVCISRKQYEKLTKAYEQGQKDMLQKVEELLPYGVGFADRFYQLKQKLEEMK
jgi:hypothetical protein